MARRRGGSTWAKVPIAPAAPAVPSVPAPPAEVRPAEVGVLDELRLLRARHLVEEVELVERARAEGFSWAQLAPACGVASGQAVRQRFLRRRWELDRRGNL